MSTAESSPRHLRHMLEQKGYFSENQIHHQNAGSDGQCTGSQVDRMEICQDKVKSHCYQNVQYSYIGIGRSRTALTC